MLEPDYEWVEKTLSQMTLEEKVGQLIMPVHSSVEGSMEFIKKYSVGGFWIARGEVHQFAGELNQLQSASKYPLLISADFEKGVGTYIDGATELPSNMALGASQDPELAYLAGKITAQEARAIGVHITFSPVVDVNNNPKNPIINIRSYGEDPDLVAKLGLAFVRGAQENGLLTTAKHFPGHGNTGVDSHTRLGTVDGTLDELNRVELYPYRFILNHTNLAGIMTAHLWVKALDKDTVPATLSPRIITDLLRKEMKFDGVIYTDAMVMGGITTRYSLETSVVLALKAGCDVILFPEDVARSVQAIVDAVKKGQLSEERINESVRRILSAKTKVGLHKHRLTDIQDLDNRISATEHYEQAKKIAAQTITLVKDDGTFGATLDVKKKVAVLSISNQQGNSIISRGLVSFPDLLKKYNPEIQSIVLNDSITAGEAEQAFRLVQNTDVVVVAAYIKIVINRGDVDLPEQHQKFLKELLSRKKKDIVFVSFGSPYILSYIPELPNYICAYDNSAATQEVTAEMLFSKIKPKGLLPVTILNEYRYGAGIKVNR